MANLPEPTQDISLGKWLLDTFEFPVGPEFPKAQLWTDGIQSFETNPKPVVAATVRRMEQ
jgi:hypothetical protein